jgi:hypothetical protein
MDFPIWGWGIVVLVGVLIQRLTAKPKPPKPQNIEDVLPAGDVVSLKISDSIIFDDVNKALYTAYYFKETGWGLSGNINYSEMLDYDFFENGHAVQGGGFGEAAIGGLLFGGDGAITGAVIGKKTVGYNRIFQIRIKINSNLPVVVLEFNQQSDIGATTHAYQAMQKLDEILGKPKQAAQSAPTHTAELREYKQLLDDGIITQEDFNAKKREILKI